LPEIPLARKWQTLAQAAVPLQNAFHLDVSIAPSSCRAPPNRVITQGPQTITRNGRNVAVIVSVEEWERKTKRKGNLAEFFAASPLRKSGLRIERTKDGPREMDL